VVFSDDPETGLAGPREVLATWPNTDSLAEFGVGGRAGTCSLLRPDPKPKLSARVDAAMPVTAMRLRMVRLVMGDRTLLKASFVEPGER